MLEDFAPPGKEKAAPKQGAADRPTDPTARDGTPKSNATPEKMQDAKRPATANKEASA